MVQDTSGDSTPKLANYKRIIACADGTWLSSNTGDKAVPSNVAKLARSVANNGLDAEGNVVKQIVFYHSGLGTGDLPFQKAIYGGLGWGLDVDVLQIYDFIANNYVQGDEIFLFGFSRGAFTVRSVAGIVCNVGVLDAKHMSRFPELWKEFCQNTSGVPFTRSAWYLNNQEELGLEPVRVKVVGVWDTVGALGIPEWPIVTWAQKIGIQINKEFAFHDTRVSKFLDYAFQALAIDEKRITFPPTLWHQTTDGPAKELQQCWFSGVHGNIGGQAEELRALGDHEEIGYNTFAWMVDNLSGMLTFEDEAIKLIIEGHQHALNRIQTANGWGCGPIVDNFAGIQGLFFWLLGRRDRTPGQFPRDPGDGTAGSTNEHFHPIVRMRKCKVSHYQPRALQGYSFVEPTDKTGWHWTKLGVQDVPEWVMHPAKVMSVAYEEGTTTKFRTDPSLSRRLCPKNILLDLDRDNGLSNMENGDGVWKHADG